MRGEGHIICQTDSFLLEANPGLALSLEKFISTEDVTTENVSDALGERLIISEDGIALPVP